jgi:hypothetical protein
VTFLSDSSELAARIVGIRESNHLLGTPLVDGAWAQWGQATVGSVGAGSEATTAVTFTKPFANTSYRVYLTVAQTTTSFELHIRSNAKATTGFNVITSNSGASGATDVLVDWLAIGV